MKKILLTISFLLIIICSVCNAQIIGVKGGVTNSSLDLGGKSNRETFLNYGIYYRYQCHNIGFSAEPSINSKGGSTPINLSENGASPVSEKAVYKFSYFELPLTVGYYSGEKVVLGANVGVNPCFLLSARAKSHVMGNNSIANTKGFNLDLIASAVLGYYINENVNIGLNVRYGMGLRPVMDGNASSKYQYINPYLTVAYKFNCCSMSH